MGKASPLHKIEEDLDHAADLAAELLAGCEWITFVYAGFDDYLRLHPTETSGDLASFSE